MIVEEVVDLSHERVDVFEDDACAVERSQTYTRCGPRNWRRHYGESTETVFDEERINQLEAAYKRYLAEKQYEKIY
jgi:hypothetical protein